jgi:hypothetical protein
MMKCRLCGSLDDVLTLEHIPPRSTGNRGRGELVLFTATPMGRRERRQLTDGVSLRVLCLRCNNGTGSRLGTTFSDFTCQVRASAHLDNPAGGVFVPVADVYPARVLRQLLLTYLCAQPYDDRPEWAELRQFIRSRDPGLPASAPRVSLYYNPSDSYRVVPVSSVGAIDGSRRNWVGSEVAAPGLGVLFSLPGSNHVDVGRLVGREPLDISEWAEQPFDRVQTLALTLPRLRVEEPHPLGFGRLIDFERWQTRNMIVWMIPEVDHPDAITAVAAAWRVEGRRRR